MDMTMFNPVDIGDVSLEVFNILRKEWENDLKTEAQEWINRNPTPILLSLGTPVEYEREQAWLKHYVEWAVQWWSNRGINIAMDNYIITRIRMK